VRKQRLAFFVLCLTINFGAIACQPSQSMPTTIPTSTIPLLEMPSLSETPTTTPTPTLRPTPWPLEVVITDKTVPTCAQLMQIRPGKSTLQDVYAIVGYPDHRGDFPTGIALGFYSQHVKFKHIILIDGVTGEVLLVGIVTWEEPGCPSLTTLKAQYGEPVLAVTNGNRKHWFFEGQDIADTEMVLQILLPGTTLEQYQAHNGYFDESYAFTP
jgi:hypothetical protein